MIPVCSIYLCFAEIELSCQSESKEALGNESACISKLLSLGVTDSVKMIPQISTVSSTVNTLPSHSLCWEPMVCRSREYEGGATNAWNGLFPESPALTYRHQLPQSHMVANREDRNITLCIQPNTTED